MKRFFQLIERNLFSRTHDLVKKDEKIKPVITISREFGSGGSHIAKLVVQRLGKPWKLYHQEIVEELAKEAKLQKELIEEIDENKVPLIEEIIDDFFGNRYLNLNRYSKHLVRVLSTIANRGYAVIVGRGSGFLLPDRLNIRIIGTMEYRAQTLMKHMRLSRDDAERLIENKDDKRRQFVQTLYRHDSRKAHHYDLVIRTSEKLTVDDATSIIVNLAKRKFKL